MRNLFIWFVLLCMVMLNPPIFSLINAYAVRNPFWGPLPVLYVWFYGWLTILVIGLVVAAVTSPDWNGVELERRLTEYLKERRG